MSKTKKRGRGRPVGSGKKAQPRVRPTGSTREPIETLLCRLASQNVELSNRLMDQTNAFAAQTCTINGLIHRVHALEQAIFSNPGVDSETHQDESESNGTAEEQCTEENGCTQEAAN